MTAQEIAMIVAKVREDRQHDYAPSSDSERYDRYGCSRDGQVFDHDHTEDVFPY